MLWNALGGTERAQVEPEVRRRTLLATLRIVGITRGALFRLLLLEAALLGLVGTVLGLLLGTLTAHYLVQLVTRTINDLYFVLTVTRLLVEPLVLWKGTLVGLGITLLAAVAPALEAANTVPVSALRRSQLEHRVHRGLPWLAGLGLAALLALALPSLAEEIEPGQVQLPLDLYTRLIDATRLLSITANLGDTKTTITHPASTTHGRLSEEERAVAGISDGLIRIAVGLEDIKDICADLESALPG